METLLLQGILRKFHNTGAEEAHLSEDVAAQSHSKAPVQRTEVQAFTHLSTRNHLKGQTHGMLEARKAERTESISASVPDQRS